MFRYEFTANTKNKQIKKCVFELFCEKNGEREDKFC